MIQTAQDFLNYCYAGLELAGQDEDGELEWFGEDKNWMAHAWLADGVYENEPDRGKATVEEYLRT